MRVGSGLGEAQQPFSTRTSGCLTSDYRMWENDNYSGAQLCVYGTPGILNLADYTWTAFGVTRNWANDVRSIKTASHTGEYAETEFSFLCCSVICIQGPSEDDPDTDSCVDTADWFSFDESCNVPC